MKKIEKLRSFDFKNYEKNKNSKKFVENCEKHLKWLILILIRNNKSKIRRKKCVF